MITSHNDALSLIEDAYNNMVGECTAVLGSELHYQAMVYHSLRLSGVPASQIGMNVKMWISDPITPLFQTLDLKKNCRFRGGFEPIPDVVIFSPAINGDWRRRNRRETLKHSLVAIEVKASERHKGRLRQKEIICDIEKLSAHRDEAIYRGAGFAPVILIVDSAPDLIERMTRNSLECCITRAEKEDVGIIYIATDTSYMKISNSRWT